jgi:hypothetical protein
LIAHTAYRATKKPIIIEISSDSDEEQYSTGLVRHPRTRLARFSRCWNVKVDSFSSGPRPKTKVKQEEVETASKVDRDIDNLLEDGASEVTLDSIMDHDSDEEEEEEVNDLLAEDDS